MLRLLREVTRSRLCLTVLLGRLGMNQRTAQSDIGAVESALRVPLGEATWPIHFAGADYAPDRPPTGEDFEAVAFTNSH